MSKKAINNSQRPQYTKNTPGTRFFAGVELSVYVGT